MVDAVDVQIKKIIANELAVDWQDIKDTDQFVADLDADSLDSALIITAVQSLCQLRISMEQAAKFKTVSDLIEWVRKHQ